MLQACDIVADARRNEADLAAISARLRVAGIRENRVGDILEKGGFLKPPDAPRLREERVS